MTRRQRRRLNRGLATIYGSSPSTEKTAEQLTAEAALWASAGDTDLAAVLREAAKAKQ